MKNLPIAIVALLGVCLVVPVATAADGDLPRTASGKPDLSGNYDISMTIGELGLFPAVNAKGPDWEIAVMGVSCRQQVEHGTGRQARHLVEVLRDCLA